MNAHLDSMRKSYKFYLDLLQKTIDDERETLNLTINRKWSELTANIDENLTMKHKMEAEKAAFYNKELARIKLNHIEAIRSARISLETDQNSVLVEVAQLKANCMLNSEKFDYNYQILSKKCDENVTIRNQEKRKLAKMHDKIISLKKQIRDVRANFISTSKRSSDEIIRFHTSLMELESRADREAKINDKKVLEKIKLKNIGS